MRLFIIFKKTVILNHSRLHFICSKKITNSLHIKSKLNWNKILAFTKTPVHKFKSRFINPDFELVIHLIFGLDML